MFAFVSYAGGMMEFRLTQREDGSIGVRHWCMDVSGDHPDGQEMMPDRSKKTEVFPDIFQAMEYVAKEIKP